MERDILNRRLACLRRLLRRRGLDGVLLTAIRNVRYFSGFAASGEGDGFLLAEPRRTTLLTDGRFTEQAELECPHLRRVVRTGKMLDVIVSSLAGRKVRRLGVEGNHLTVAYMQVLEKALKGIRVKALGGELEAMREVKDGSELSAIGKAVAVAQKAMLTLVAGGARKLAGRTERQVAAELEYQMRLAGADRAAFETIVASGAHSSRPHYRAGDRVIRRGDAVLIDWGAMVGGYCSDLTRVLFVSTIPPQLGRVYEVVRRAQAAGLAAVSPGARGQAVDAAAREVIARAGYGDAFGHGLGHGLGLEVHEGPRLARKATGRLRAGMVVTVEPGIYLPGVGGVRLEDDVLVTESGRRRLSSLPRDLKAWLLR